MVPTIAAATIPNTNCPPTPILNSPHLKATALATPVKIKGVTSANVVIAFLDVPKLPFHITETKSVNAVKY